MSRFGTWTDEDGLPAFDYLVDPATTPAAVWDPILTPPTNRHWAVLGNRRINLLVDNLGTVAMFDEHEGLRFVTAPDPEGTGVSLVDGSRGEVQRRQFGPTWFAVDVAVASLDVRRTISAPEGEEPWVLVRVDLRNPGTEARTVTHTEQWALHPQCISLNGDHEIAPANGRVAIRYRVEARGEVVVAHEERTEAGDEMAALRHPTWFGTPHTVVLEALGAVGGVASATDEAQPTLEVTTPVMIEPGGAEVLWFRFGLSADGSGDFPAMDDPSAAVERWRDALVSRLPRASANVAPAASREIPWHAALLTGGACVDGVLGGHTLDQASTYSYHWGFNGAARDPLQHALPLVYSEPDLALSVLRNTCAWGGPSGELPYGLNGSKGLWTAQFQPSDQSLWSLWLAAEYGAATGDLAAFSAPVAFHPVHEADPVPLAQHLRRHFRFLVEDVGLGEHGHLRIRNADWNDVAIETSGVPRDVMIEKGESVLNSAMAAWVLPVYAGLCDRLGDSATARSAREFGNGLRDAVATEWNGRWFRRAYGPGAVVGEEDFWLEGQPWAILCGAATPDQAEQLLRYIDDGPRSNSPLGTRVRWPVVADDGLGGVGDATNGGIWYSINATVVWAAARLDPALAWDEWRRMTLDSHESSYPKVWEGTISGPDCYNSPESERPGRTWAIPGVGLGMQSFPVGNLHSHAQPIHAYLRLLGIEPTADGALRVAGAEPSANASFASQTFAVDADGSGRLSALGPVTVDTGRGRVEGGPGELAW